MHTRDLVDEVARRKRYRYGLSREKVRAALGTILDVITEQMAQGNAVSIASFGRFEAKEHKRRKVEGLDGEEYQVGSRLGPGRPA